MSSRFTPRDPDGMNRDKFIDDVARVMMKDVRHALDEATRTCINCMSFVRTEQTCGYNGKVPPPMVAARGCELWSYEIPF